RRDPARLGVRVYGRQSPRRQLLRAGEAEGRRAEGRARREEAREKRSRSGLGSTPAVGWIDLELVLVSVAAMLSPTTLTFSILTLVLSNRPLRSGFWFFLGAVTATLAIGVLAAFVLTDVASSHGSSSPKTWVAVVDVVAGALLLAWVGRALRRPPNQERADKMLAQMEKVAASPAIALAGARAMLANPAGF